MGGLLQSVLESYISFLYVSNETMLEINCQIVALSHNVFLIQLHFFHLAETIGLDKHFIV